MLDFNTFCSILIRNGIIDPVAISYPKGYDNYFALTSFKKAFGEISEILYPPTELNKEIFITQEQFDKLAEPCNLGNSAKLSPEQNKNLAIQISEDCMRKAQEIR